MLWLCNCLRALLRIRRSADFVFGIKSIKLERGTLSEWREMSTGVLGFNQAEPGRISTRVFMACGLLFQIREKIGEWGNF